MSSATKKIAFQKARREAGITSRQVADRAGVSLGDEYLMELKSPVTQEFAERILSAFSQLVGQAWTIAEMDIPLKDVGDSSSTEHQAPLSMCKKEPFMEKKKE